MVYTKLPVLWVYLQRNKFFCRCHITAEVQYDQHILGWHHVILYTGINIYEETCCCHLQRSWIKKIKLGGDLNSMFNNIHPNSYDTVVRTCKDTNSTQKFSFLWPLLKSSILTQIKYGYSSILYAHLVLSTVNSFKCKIHTGCLDHDEKEMAQKKLHHKQRGEYWYDLLFIFRISSSLQCCEWRLLFFCYKGNLIHSSLKQQGMGHSERRYM